MGYDPHPEGITSCLTMWALAVDSVSNSGSPLTGWVIWGKYLHLSAPRFSHLGLMIVKVIKSKLCLIYCMRLIGINSYSSIIDKGTSTKFTIQGSSPRMNPARASCLRKHVPYQPAFCRHRGPAL